MVNTEEKIMVATLVTGQMLVFKDNVVNIEEPCFAVPIPGQNPNQINITFQPLLLLSSENYCQPLNGALVLVSYPADKDISRAYRQFVDTLKAQRSGIVAPTVGQMAALKNKK